MKPEQTKVHPLRTTAKNETVTTELKDALLDFFGQIGQKEGDYLKRILLVGGDGLTYQKMIELQRYLQFHRDPFQSFELVRPILAVWHTAWTDLSRLVEEHWGSLLDPDPSSLGHSASQMGIATTPNLKKVDYYPTVDMVKLVLETRMLDCWR
jgi:hypothetical protein